MKEGWKTKTLDTVASIYNGNSINADYKKKHFLGLAEGYPFIATKDVSFDGTVDYNNGVRIPFNTDYKIAEPDSVFICVEGGSAGRKIAYIDQKVCFGNKLFCVKPLSSHFVGKFVYYFLISEAFQVQFRSLLTGLIGGVSAKKFKSITISYPPLSDQQRIVSYLDAEFAKIEALKANAEKQLQAAKDLFQAALKELLTPKEGWVEKNITQLAENLDSKRIPITSHLRKKGIYPYYGASGIVDYVADYIFDDDLLLISEDGANLLARSTPIAFSVSGKIWVNNHAHIFKFTNMCTQKYVEYYFASINVSEYVTGAAQPKLAQKMLNRIPISIPDNIKEQKAIVSQLDKIYDHCQSLEGNYTETITLCNDLKQALLKKVFG